MIRPACLVLCLLGPVGAGEWTPRASEREHEQLRHTLRSWERTDSSAEREMLLLQAAEQRGALQDLLADPQRQPEFLTRAGWEACAQVLPPQRERLLVQIARKRVLDTPQAVLEELGRLARRADAGRTSHAEKTLLALLGRAQEEPEGDWTHRLRLARALAEGGGQRSARALVALLARSRPMTGDERQLSEDLARLAEHREVTVCQTLVASASRAESPRQRYLGHTALAAVASPRTRSYLRGAMQAGARRRVDTSAALSPDLRATIDGLARIDTPSAIDSLIEQEQWIPRHDVALRTALYKALGQARRSAEITDLVPTLVDWLGEAEAEAEPKQLRLALVESLRSLTGARYSAHHASWARYVASLERER